MKINDEKRREVAQRLREVETLEYDGDVWCDEGDVLDALGLYNNDDPSSCDPDKVEFLADLIDRPTCFDTDNKDSKFFTCGACGFSDSQITVNPFTLSILCVKPSYRYCPNCGAEVTK